MTGVPFDPFHLKREREEGYFDEVCSFLSPLPLASHRNASCAPPSRAAEGDATSPTPFPPSPLQSGTYVEYKQEEEEDAWADALARALPKLARICCSCCAAPLSPALRRPLFRVPVPQTWKLTSSGWRA